MLGIAVHFQLVAVLLLQQDQLLSILEPYFRTKDCSVDSMGDLKRIRIQDQLLSTLEPNFRTKDCSASCSPILQSACTNTLMSH
jgi:hypothetical protein